MQISKVLNANVYIDGSLDLLGKAKQITLPEVTMTVEAHKALGMLGSIEYPVGLEPLVMRISWHGWYPEALQSANPFASHKLQIRATHQTFGAGGLEQTQPLVVLVTASWKKQPLGTFAPGAHADTEDELSVTYLKVTLGGAELLEIDVHNNVYRVNGEDVLAEYREAMGG